MQEGLIVIFLAMSVSSTNQKYLFFKKANFKGLPGFRNEKKKFTPKISIVSVSQKKALLLSNHIAKFYVRFK